MSCARFDEVHLAALDGPLEPALRVEFDEHLAACPACAERWKGYTATVAILEGLREHEEEDSEGTHEPPLPEELVKRILLARTSANQATRGNRRSG